MRRLLCLSPLLAILEQPATACTRDALQASVDRATAAWSQRDLDVFRAAREQIAADLACQQEILPRDLVLNLHLTSALAAYLPPRDTESVEAAFRAALEIDPAFALDQDLAPRGHLLQTLLDQARAPIARTLEPVTASLGCRVLVNGREAEARVVELPALIQQACDSTSGPVALVPAGAPLPSWATTPATPIPEPPAPVAPAPSRRPKVVKVALLAGGGGALAASGGLLAGALSARSEWKGYAADIATGGLPEGEASKVEGSRQRANALGYGAQAGAAVGLGLLTTALVVRW